LMSTVLRYSDTWLHTPFTLSSDADQFSSPNTIQHYLQLPTWQSKGKEMHMQATKLRNIAIFSPLLTVRNRVTVYQLFSSMSFGLCEECKPHYILRLSSHLMRKQCGVEIKRRNVIEIKPKNWQFLCIL